MSYYAGRLLDGCWRGFLSHSLFIALYSRARGWLYEKAIAEAQDATRASLEEKLSNDSL